MISYENHLLGVQIKFPDDWRMWIGKEREIEKFARRCKAGEDPGTTILVVAGRQNSPGSEAMIDASIEMRVCHDNFVNATDPAQLKKQDVNGIETFQVDSVNASSPESIFFNFVHWRASTGMSVHVRIQATGTERLKYVRSIFETLSPIGSTNHDKIPLFECEPWCVPPTVYRMTIHLDEKRKSLDDLKLKAGFSDKAWRTNEEVLRGREPVKKWKVMKMERGRRVPALDCYYGPPDFSGLGVFSEQVCELLRSDFEEYFAEVPCPVNDQQYFALVPKPVDSCLDVDNCQIRRFDDGRIMQICRYRFDQRLIHDPLIFAVPEDRTSIFATASIRDKVEQAELTGIAFLAVDGNGREFTFADDLANEKSHEA